MRWATFVLVLVLAMSTASAAPFGFVEGDSHYLGSKIKFALMQDLGTKYKFIRDPNANADGMVFFYMHFPEVSQGDVRISFKFSQYDDAFVEVYSSSSAPSALYDVPAVKSLIYSSRSLGDVTDYTATFTIPKGSGEYVYFVVTLPYYSSSAAFYLYKEGSYEVTAPSPTPTPTTPTPSPPVTPTYGVDTVLACVIAFAVLVLVAYLLRT